MATLVSLRLPRARLLLPILGMLAACGTDPTPPGVTDPGRTSSATAFLPPALLQHSHPAPPHPSTAPQASGCTGGCPADSTIITFEDLGTAGEVLVLADQYSQEFGITFANAIVAIIPAFNYDEFPPRSGVASATADPFLSGDGSGTLFLSLDSVAIRVRGYITSFSPLTLRCFDAGGSPLAETVFPGSNLAIEHGGPANQPVEVSAPGIRSCRFLGPDNQYSLDDLTVVWGEGESNLTLSCPSTVVRADSAVCTASAPGAFTFEVVSWSFRPAGIDTVLHREDVMATDTTWGGPIVASGEVRVEALVNDSLVSASAVIEVTARDWSALEIELDLSEDSPGDFTFRATEEHELGETDHFPILLDRIVRTSMGPNTGIWYFSGLPFRVKAVVTINTAALNGSSPFIARQYERRRMIGNKLFCARDEALGLYLPGVQRHEGLGGRADLNSHVAIYTSHLEQSARERFEPLVWGNAFPSMSIELNSLHASADSASRFMDHPQSGLNPFTPPCHLRYYPN